MRILGIETSGDQSSVCLLDGLEVVAERVFPARMSLCQTLPGHIEAVLGEAVGTRLVASDAGDTGTTDATSRVPTNHAVLGEAVGTRLVASDARDTGTTDATSRVPTNHALDAIAVSLGPGSFTGLRIGVALAKAMAHAWELPLVGVPTHEALALTLNLSDAQRACVVQHARKSDVYTTTFARGGNDKELVPTGPCAVLPVTELLSRLKRDGEPMTFIGDGVDRHKGAIVEALGDLAEFADAAQAYPSAIWVAVIGVGRLRDADPDAAFNLRPIYVLASQAERQQGVDLGLS